MGKFNEYDETENFSNDSSEQDSWARTWDLSSFEEDTRTIDESDTGYASEIFKQIEDVDSQYKAAKNDIEASKSVDEKSYWIKREEKLREQGDQLGFKIGPDQNNNK